MNEVLVRQRRGARRNLIGEENKGWTYAKHLLAHERTNIADVNRAKRELERLKRIAKAEGLWDDTRFRDRSPCSKGRGGAGDDGAARALGPSAAARSRWVAGLLKIRGSEICNSATPS